jgi:hypothetical protein
MTGSGRERHFSQNKRHFDWSAERFRPGMENTSRILSRVFSAAAGTIDHAISRDMSRLLRSSDMTRIDRGRALLRIETFRPIAPDWHGPLMRSLCATILQQHEARARRWMRDIRPEQPSSPHAHAVS